MVSGDDVILVMDNYTAAQHVHAAGIGLHVCLRVGLDLHRHAGRRRRHNMRLGNGALQARIIRKSSAGRPLSLLRYWVNLHLNFPLLAA